MNKRWTQCGWRNIVLALVGGAFLLPVAGVALAQTSTATFPPTNFTQGSSPTNTVLNLNFNTGTLPQLAFSSKLRLQYGTFVLACANTVSACGVTVGLCATSSTGNPNEITWDFGAACANKSPSPVVVDLTGSNITGANFFLDSVTPAAIPTLSDIGLLLLSLLIVGTTLWRFRSRSS